MRVGIVGAGFGARAHVAGWRAAGCEVVAICASREDRARDAAAHYGVAAWTTDAAALVGRDDVDLVAVASPPFVHREHVLAALAAGKHVLCEKPFAMDASAAREMLHAAERAGVVHAIDHEFRYVPARLRLRELIQEGALGEVRAVHVVDYGPSMTDATAPRAEWWLRRDRAGGLVGAIGSHWIDSLRWWCGDVRLVAAQLAAFVPERPTTAGGRIRVTADDTAEVLLRFESGTIATLHLSTVARHTSKRVMVFGSEGSAVLGGNGRLLYARAGAELGEILPEPPNDIPSGAGRGSPRFLVDAFAELATRVRRHVEAGPAGEHDVEHPTFLDGLRAQEVLDAVYASAEGAGMVAVR